LSIAFSAGFTSWCNYQTFEILSTTRVVIKSGENLKNPIRWILLVLIGENWKYLDFFLIAAQNLIFVIFRY
jgi:hypothetical protein